MTLPQALRVCSKQHTPQRRHWNRLPGSSSSSKQSSSGAARHFRVIGARLHLPANKPSHKQQHSSKKSGAFPSPKRPGTLLRRQEAGRWRSLKHRAAFARSREFNLRHGGGGSKAQSMLLGVFKTIQNQASDCCGSKNNPSGKAWRLQGTHEHTHVSNTIEQHFDSRCVYTPCTYAHGTSPTAEAGHRVRHTQLTAASFSADNLRRRVRLGERL